MKSRRIPCLLLTFCVTTAVIGLYGTAPTARGETTPAADEAKKAAAAKESEEYYELMKLFVDALDQVERNYVKDLDRRELVEAAIDGMLTKLDQHTDYIAPDDLDRFRSGVENQFGGIGIQISVEQGKLTIVSPLVGTPAYRAGLMAGDIITHINGQPTKGLGLDKAVKQLKGVVGSKVQLKVLDPDDRSVKSVDLERETIRVETVLGNQRRDDDSWEFMCDQEQKIAFVRLTAFGRNTSKDLRKVLRELRDQGMQGLILDLRFNPGGLLSSAVEVSDMFVPKGRIVSTSGRNVVEQKWDAHRIGTFEGFPMAVLVNQYSASASEIVSACLQDHERAIVVGQRTFGKGSVQNIIELERGKSALKLTTAGYHRPSGKNIDRAPDAGAADEWGVKPNDGYEVRLSEPATRQLLRSRQKRDIVPDEDHVAEIEDEEVEEVEDVQFAKALEYVTQQIVKDEDQVAAGNAAGDAASDEH